MIIILILRRFNTSKDGWKSVFFTNSVFFYFRELVWVVDFFIRFKGHLVSARALKQFNYEQLTTRINALIQTLPEEGRPRGIENTLKKGCQ